MGCFIGQISTTLRRGLFILKSVRVDVKYLSSEMNKIMAYKRKADSKKKTKDKIHKSACEKKFHVG